MADNLHQVLESYEKEHIQLEGSFLNQALIAATLNDNHECIGKLIKMGARNIDECITLAKERGLIKSKAMLFLIKAAQTGESTLLHHVHQYVNSSLNLELTSDSVIFDGKVIKAVLSGEVSTLIPLELAQQFGQHSTRREILMLTNTNHFKGHVDWSRLNLVSLDAQLLERLHSWLREFKLSSNMLRSIPAEFQILKEATHIDLSDNELTTIPVELLDLPNLKTLNLSHNKVVCIPYTRKVSLANLDLSDNHLSSLPVNLSAPVMSSLNISNNHFTHVPLCICTFTSLTTLDLSGNNIRVLPYEMAMLTKLMQLNLNGLKRLNKPPKYIQNTCQDVIAYLQEKFKTYIDGSYCMQLMIVGNPGRGKHTLASRLQNRNIEHDKEGHQGVHVSEWEYQPGGSEKGFEFRMWIFHDLDQYTPTHQCFLNQSSLYLLLFDLKLGSEGVHELKPWLSCITQAAPHSGIIIIGTHSDQVPDHDVGLLLQQAKMVVAAYGSKLKTVALLSADLKHSPGSVPNIRKKILHYAFTYPVLQQAVIREICTNSERVNELLNNPTAKCSLDPQFFKEALRAAIEMDSDVNIGHLALSGPTDIPECIKFAEKEGKPHARALLMLLMAAQTGNMDVLNQLCLETADKERFSASDSKYSVIHSSVLLVNVTPTAPIEIAHKNANFQIRDVMVMKTNVYPEEKTVYWSGLQLKQLDISWISGISWVEQLKLDRNGLTVLSNEIGQYLQQIVGLDLQRNHLSVLPRFIFELPNLQELNLSHNKLENIPAVSKWSFCLTNLNLFNNQLTSLPSQITASSIFSLNIGRNKLNAVPPCICSFTTLQSLDLSDNPNITVLPAQMDQLNSLSHLNLKGLKKLKEPPRDVQMDCRKCIRYLNEKFKRFTAFYEIKLMVLGHANRGKTTLVNRLQGREDRKKSTIGLNVSKWSFRPSVARRTFNFNIWDFGSMEECYSAYRCFFTQNAIYLVLFNLLHGKQAVELELHFWLNSVAFYAPQSCVIIIGTHLDQIAEKNRGAGGDTLLSSVSELALAYKNRLLIVEVIPVALENQIENIGLLKEAIYNHAAKYKNHSDQLIMGQRIPASYHALAKRFEVIQQEVKRGLRKPFMHTENFRSIMNEMNLTDIIASSSELKKVASFLTEIGSLLHYDEYGHNLHEVYFTDPSWLYEIISNVIITGKSKIAIHGILHSEDFGLIVQDRSFPWQYIEQYITLLDKFEIALPLDSRRLLIPSMLPIQTKSSEIKEIHFYSRYFLFSSATPPGLWGRLLSHIMYTIEKFSSFALERLVPIHYDSDVSSTNAYPDSITCFNSMPSTTNSKALVLPNFPQPKHLLPFNSFDSKDIHIKIWQTGLYYSDPEVMFKIEPIVGSKQASKQSNHGIIIIASRNTAGIKAISELIDLVTSLIREWYPDLQRRKHGLSGLKQRVACFECVKLGRASPFEFDIEQCLQAIVENRTTVKCGYCQDGSKKNHSVAIEDIAPDLLLLNINPEYFLHPQDISYQENQESLLGKGGYAEVYRGKFKGKKSIAVKRYLSRFSEQGLCELQFEAKMHCRLKHPCIVKFIGIYLQPFIALVVEEAPLNSAAYHFLEKKTPICRLTVFRIAAEVAAALQYMHSQRIVYRDVKAENVLLWTLDPDSLCHSKLCDLNIAACLSPIGIRGLHGCKGFTAPELMHTGKGKPCSLYDHRADVFSYGMFVYQMIARRHPYHNIPTYRVDLAVEEGERPKLQENSGYYYLTQLMERCWEASPTNRPDMKENVKNLCLSSMQMVMNIISVQSKRSLRQAVSVPKSISEDEHNLWVCCDSANGMVIRVYNMHTMKVVKKVRIQENQIQCMTPCGEHIWVATRTGLEYGVIDIYSRVTAESIHKIHMRDKSVTCITANNETVYFGTSDGFCISYKNDIQSGGILPKENHVSQCAVDGIICTDGSVWISHTERVSYLDLETLNVLGTINLDSSKRAHEKERKRESLLASSSEMKTGTHVGQLACGVDHILWAAHIGGTLLSVWNTQTKCHLYSINTIKHVKRITKSSSHHKLALISAMTPALDTVWVGMASGHILIFHEDKLLSWFYVFEDYVRFLTCVPTSGPCGREQCMVASGGKNVKPLVPLCKFNHTNEGSASYIVIWEAYDAKTIQQIKLIEEQSPGHLDNYDTLNHIIRAGDFKDVTGIFNSLPNGSFSNANDNPVCNNCIVSQEKETETTEELIVQLLNPKQTVKVTCSKPTKLDSVMNELQLVLNLGEGQLKQLAYCIDGSQVLLKHQVDLEAYLTLPVRPPLLVT